MAGKINSLNGAPSAIGSGRPAEKTADAASGGSTAAASTPGDVHITGPASLLATLEQQLRNMPAVDQARVAQFRTAIESGGYTIQSGQVAHQLMLIERSLAQITGG